MGCIHGCALLMVHVMSHIRCKCPYCNRLNTHSTVLRYNRKIVEKMECNYCYKQFKVIYRLTTYLKTVKIKQQRRKKNEK